VPFQISLKANNIFDYFLIVGTKEDLRVVLILNVQLHWRFNNCCDSDQIWSVGFFKKVKDWRLVALRCVEIRRGTHDWRLNNVVSILGHVLASFNVKTVGDLNFKNFDRLFDSKVGHFDVKSVEVDSIKTLVHCVREFTLTGMLNPNLVIQSAALVENTNEVVHLDYCSWVLNECWPIRINAHSSMLGFKLLNNFREVPRESKYVCMFLLWEQTVSTNSGVLSFETICVLWLSRW